MFDSLFGWRKANKCKRLIRRVQCRLKLLKNKRCTIVRQLREDVAQLLKYGHEHNAFNRVEQIFKDESMVEVYDLLDNFCEFIIIHLPYIRKHKDCPSDINEAVSSLVFASARCGDLPELTTIRRLFEERYGLRFTRVALELLPGNLVNLTIRENLSIKCVPNDVKYSLVDEIARTSCLQAEPLALEYTSEWEQRVASRPEIQENKGEIVPYNGIYKESELQASNVISNDGKIVDFSPEVKGTPMEPNQNIRKRSRRAGLVDQSSSSESSLDHMPDELVYLDDIEEFKSRMTKDGTYQDQRVFVFKPSIVPTSNKFEVKAGSTKKSEKGNGDRRKSLFSLESRNVNDMECAIYYGNAPNHNSGYHHPRQRLKKKHMKEGPKACYAKLDHPFDEMVSTCSLEEPCYHSACDDKNALECPPLIYYIPSSCNGVPINMEGGLLLVPLSMRDNIVFLDDLLADKPKTQLEEVSETVSPPTEKGENRHNYLRAMTMPPERPKKDVRGDDFLRSNSFPVQQHSDRLSNASSTCPHVHPNLPDYDELASKFMALKKEVLQKKNQKIQQ